MDGFSDPVFTISQRLHDSRDDGFYVDSVLSFTPALGHELSAGGGQTGNDLTGGWNASASIPLYYRQGLGGFVDEIEVDPRVTRFFGGASSGVSPHSSSLTSSYWYGSVLVEDRFHFNRSWFLQPGVTVYIPYTYQTESQASGATATDQKSNLYAAPTLMVGYLPLDWILLDASVTFSQRGTESSPAAGLASSTETTQTYAGVQAQVTF